MEPSLHAMTRGDGNIRRNAANHSVVTVLGFVFQEASLGFTVVKMVECPLCFARFESPVYAAKKSSLWFQFWGDDTATQHLTAHEIFLTGEIQTLRALPQNYWPSQYGNNLNPTLPASED
jgi:hypothetical protein